MAVWQARRSSPGDAPLARMQWPTPSAVALATPNLLQGRTELLQVQQVGAITRPRPPRCACPIMGQNIGREEPLPEVVDGALEGKAFLDSVTSRLCDLVSKTVNCRKNSISLSTVAWNPALLKSYVPWISPFSSLTSIGNSVPY